MSVLFCVSYFYWQCSWQIGLETNGPWFFFSGNLWQMEICLQTRKSTGLWRRGERARPRQRPQIQATRETQKNTEMGRHTGRGRPVKRQRSSWRLLRVARRCSSEWAALPCFLSSPLRDGPTCRPGSCLEGEEVLGVLPGSALRSRQGRAFLQAHLDSERGRGQGWFW